MTIEEMKRLKKEWGYTNEQVSEYSGVPLGTVQKIFSGETKSPRYDTLQALEAFFSLDHHNANPGPVYDFPPKGKPTVVKEGSVLDYYAARSQGEFTSDDFQGLDEDVRIELIDGVAYNMATPTTRHQFIVTELTVEFNLFIRANGGDCLVFSAPVAVALDCDEKTEVIPDVTVLCDREKLVGDNIQGAPDLMVEVLSSSTRRKDMTVKQQKYANAGVREYWIVDPREQKVIVYDFEKDFLIRLYTFRDKVPVGIWDGQCEIDFSRIDDAIMSIFGGKRDDNADN